MNMNQKTRLKAEDMEWNVLETIRLSKEQLEADGSTRARWKTGPGNQGNQPGKGTGSIRRKKLDTYSVPDGTEYIKRKKEYDCNID